MDDSQFILAVSKGTSEYAHSGSSLQKMKITKIKKQSRTIFIGLPD
jgi:hypothetical protein